MGFPPSVRAGRRSRAARRAFIGALLDVTDNVNAAGAIVPPQAVVRRDGDDPYPVRTRAPRRCPDIANDGAAEHDFWLGDALVSRGFGHDHKEMGITAKESDNPRVTLPDAHDRSAGGEPVHRRRVGGWFPGEDGLAVVHGAEHVRLALNSFLVS